MPEPVNVVCIKWGTRYNGPYVNTLASMVARHLKRPHRFICFTDDASGFSSRVEAKPLPMDSLSNLSASKFESAWNKLGIFSNPLFDLTGPTLFLDLDIVIVADIDPFFEHKPGKFIIIRDFRDGHKGIGNSSVFRFEANQHVDVLLNYVQNAVEIKAKYGNEQNYLSSFLMAKDALDYWPEEWCRSFKRDCLPPTPLNWFQAAKLPADARVVVFHGTPNPADALRGMRSKMRLVRPVSWVKQHWREEPLTS
ncbi:glycosyltransferase [bacterium]|nr:MAG: glycosyltransferase [bacterium]